MFFYCIQWNPALCCFKQKTIRSKLFGGQGWRSGETHFPPTNVGRVQIPTSTPYVGWVCCWFSRLFRKVFLRVLRFYPLLKNQHFQIPIRSGTHVYLNEFIWTLKGKKAIYNFFSLLHLPTDIPWRGGTRKIRKLGDRDIIEFKSYIRNS